MPEPEICRCGAPMLSATRCDVYDCPCTAEPARADLTPELRADYDRTARLADQIYADWDTVHAAAARCAAIEDSLSLESWCELFDAEPELQLAVFYGYFTV